MPLTERPRIIVLSSDTEDSFRWMSAGWSQIHEQRLPARKALFQKAQKCIDSGVDILDVIRRLEKAGFEIVRREHAL